MSAYADTSTIETLSVLEQFCRKRPFWCDSDKNLPGVKKKSYYTFNGVRKPSDLSASRFRSDWTRIDEEVTEGVRRHSPICQFLRRKKLIFETTADRTSLPLPFLSMQIDVSKEETERYYDAGRKIGEALDAAIITELRKTPHHVPGPDHYSSYSAFEMQNHLKTNKHYGPYLCIAPLDWATDLEVEVVNTPLLQKSSGQLILVQGTEEVIRLVVGLDLLVYEDHVPGRGIVLQATCCIVPQVRGQNGVICRGLLR